MRKHEVYCLDGPPIAAPPIPLTRTLVERVLALRAEHRKTFCLLMRGRVRSAQNVMDALTFAQSGSGFECFEKPKFTLVPPTPGCALGAK